MASVTDAGTGVVLERLGPALVPPGQPVALSVGVPTPVPQTQIVPGDISLVWIQKNVLFNSGAPIPAPISDNVEGTITGGVPANLAFGNAIAAVPAAVPPTPTQASGILHQIQGVVPVAIPVVPPMPMASVAWRVCPPSASDPTVCELDMSGDLQLGVDFVAPDGMTSLTPTFIFAPRRTEDFTLGSPIAGGVPIGITTETWLIQAKVALTIGASTVEVPALHLPIQLPSLAIPTLALFCTRPNFAPTGAARRALLLLVPHDSGLAALLPGSDDSTSTQQAEAVQVFLETLRTTLVNLASVGGAGLKIAAFLLGLQRAVSLIRTYRSAARDNYVRLRFGTASGAEDGIRRLDLIDFPGDDFEDTVSSLLFLGPVGRRLETFQGREFNEGPGRETYGQLNLIAREQLFVAVGNLHVTDPVGEPPDGVAAPPHTFGGPTVEVAKPVDGANFDDVLSSARFSYAPMSPQPARTGTSATRSRRPG
jgi:hypothetical protein